MTSRLHHFSILTNKLSLKTLLIAVVLLLIGITALYRITTKPKTSASAAWWNDGWQYRSRLDITNPSGSNLTDYQVSFSVGTSALINSGHMKSDCSDIRVTDQNGTLLSQHLQKNCNSPTAAVFWVKVPSLPKDGATLYLYYGNSSASAKNDIDDVFNTNLGVSWEFNTNGNNEGWASGNNISAPVVSGGILSTVIGGSDPFILGPNGQTINAATTKYLFIKYRVTNGHNNGGIYWTTNINPSYTGAMHVTDNLVFNGGWQVVAEPVSIGASWDNTVTSLRIDPSANNEVTGNIEIDWIRVHNSGSALPTTSLAAEEVGGGPVAYWKFDEGVGSTAYDSTNNTNHAAFATGAAAPIWVSEDQCVTGKCLKFNEAQNQYATINPARFPTNTNVLTVSAWVKWQGYGSDSQQMFLNSNSGSTLRLGTNNPDTTHQLSVYCGNCTTPKWYYGQALPTNQWQYVTIVFTGTNILFYQNGVQTLNDTYSGNILAAASNWSVGSLSGATYSWNGLIDDMKVYPYARTPAQIAADYQAGQAGQSSTYGGSVNMGSSSQKNLSDGLVAYWKMDEGVGTTVVDSTGRPQILTFAAGSSAPDWSVGKFGVGLSFNASTSYLTSTTIPYVATSGRSGCAWIYPKAHTNLLATVFRKQNNHDVSIRLTTTGVFNDRVVNTAGTQSSAYQGTAVAPLNTWSHLCVVWESPGPGQNIRLRYYLNGNLDLNTVTDISDPGGYVGSSNPNSTFWIGNDPDLPTRVFNGLIDEVRIYNRALSNSDISQLYNFAPPPSAYYKFDEATGTSTLDSSGNNNTATLGSGNSAPSWTLGKINNALSFDGNSDYLSLPNSPQINPASAFTVETWIKPSSLANNTNYNILAKQDYSNKLGFRFALTGYGGCVNLNCLFLGVGNSTNLTETTSSGVNITEINQWVHLAATFDNGTIKLYKNGILGYTTTTSITSLVNTNASASIGRHSTGGEHFPGVLDDVKLYNYARTPSQIIADMNAGNPMSSSKSSYVSWNFDENSGTVANNTGFGGSAFNATFAAGSAPTWSTFAKSGKSLQFSTNQYLTYANSIFNNATSNTYSISFWSFRTPGGSAYNGVINQNNFPRLQFYGNQLIMNTFTPDTNAIAGVGTTQNVWEHWVVQITTNSVKFYKNGSFINEVAGTPTFNSSQFRLGASGAGSVNNFFQGYLDQFKVYNYLLSDDDVKREYNQSSSVVAGQSTQTIGATTTSLTYCLPGDTSYCSSPIAEWNFDENSGITTYDSSGNNNHAPIGPGTSAPVWSLGKTNWGLKFNGTTNGIAVPDNSVLKIGTSSWTASAWFKTSSPAIGSSVIVMKRNSVSTTNPGFQIQINNDHKLHSYFSDGSAARIHITGVTTVDDNRWHHVEVTFVRNGNMTLYVDGLVDNGASISAQQGDASETNPLSIGYEASYPNSWFPGTIDQVRIYNYARTPAQIAYDYNKGAPVGWWKFDECQGATAFDAAGLGNTGSISVGPSGTQINLGTCQVGTSAAWTNGASGKLNSSLNFDGSDDYVILTNGAALTAPRAVTLSAWVYSTGGQANHSGIIVGRNGAGLEEYSMVMTNNAFGFNYTTGAVWYDQAFGNVPQNTWTHLLITRNDAGDQISYYMNGQLIKKDTGSGPAGSYPTQVKSIGADRAFSATSYFKGKIDDARIYNYALTPTQILTLYNNGALNFSPASGSP